MKKRLITSLAMIAVGIVALSGCSAGGGGGDGSKDPIVLGSINGLSGAASVPEASDAAKAVFARVNAHGGIHGHKIDYKILDDKGTPEGSSSAARQLVSKDDVVALVGGASLVSCNINETYLTQNDVSMMPGIGIDPVCFSSPNIAPVNVGPYRDTRLSLTFGSEELGLDKICALLEVSGNTLPAYKAAIKAWSDDTGKKLVYHNYTLPYGASDYTPYIVKAKSSGCDAVFYNPSEADAVAAMKAAHAQGWDDVTWLMVSSVYSDQFAKAVKHVGKGLYIPAEFYPFTDSSSDATKDWRELMQKNDIDLTAFSQGGYLAATYFVDVLKSIHGDITRDSVNQALHNMKPVGNPMSGTPYVFGKAKKHNPNKTAWPVKLTSGSNEWQNAADDWISVDGK